MSNTANNLCSSPKSTTKPIATMLVSPSPRLPIGKYLAHERFNTVSQAVEYLLPVHHKYKRFAEGAGIGHIIEHQRGLLHCTRKLSPRNIKNPLNKPYSTNFQLLILMTLHNDIVPWPSDFGQLLCQSC